MQQSQSQLPEKHEQKHVQTNTHRRASTTESADRDHKTPRRGVFRKSSLTERKLRNARMQTNHRNAVLPQASICRRLAALWQHAYLAHAANTSPGSYLGTQLIAMCAALMHVYLLSSLTASSSAMAGRLQESSPSPHTGDDAPDAGEPSQESSSSSRRVAKAWLTEAEGIAVPPSQSDFAWVGKLMKRRGGFGKIALNNNNWKYRCFVLTKSGSVFYYEEESFDDIDFTRLPRGIVSLADGDCTLLANLTRHCRMALHRQDQDTPTPHVVVLQERRGAGVRWKLCALTEADCYSFIEAVKQQLDRIGSSSAVTGTGTHHHHSDSVQHQQHQRERHHTAVSSSSSSALVGNRARTRSSFNEDYVLLDVVIAASDSCCIQSAVAALALRILQAACGSSTDTVAALRHLRRMSSPTCHHKAQLSEHAYFKTFVQGHGSDSDFPVPVQMLSFKTSTSPKGSPKGATAVRSNGPKTNGHSHSDSSSSSHTAAAAAAAAAAASQRALLQYAMFLVINGLCLALHYLQLPLYHPAFFVLVAGINLAVAVASPRRLRSSNGSTNGSSSNGSEYYAVPLMHVHDVAPLVKAVKMMQHVRRKKEVCAVTLMNVSLVNVALQSVQTYSVPRRLSLRAFCYCLSRRWLTPRYIAAARTGRCCSDSSNSSSDSDST
eukprot:14468-Heterococcus_DN1.PRE.1